MNSCLFSFQSRYVLGTDQLRKDYSNIHNDDDNDDIYFLSIIKLN